MYDFFKNQWIHAWTLKTGVYLMEAEGKSWNLDSEPRAKGSSYLRAIILCLLFINVG